MKSERIHNILEGFQGQYREQPFEWGKLDCCLWVANILKAIHGIDYAEKYRGKYNSLASFKKLLVTNNFTNLEELLLEAFGTPTEGYTAVKGDPVMLIENKEELLGMCFGHYSLFLTEKGFTKRNNSSCKYSWRV